MWSIMEWQTTRRERLSYGSFFFAQNILYTIQFQFLIYFYTEDVKLSLVSTTTLLLVARLWDAFNDPLMGAIVDKVQFKNEKYLPWLRFVTYTVPLSMVFVFVNLGEGTPYTGRLVFAYITYILWGMLYTVSDSPLFSLATVMTSNTFERDVLLSHGRFAAALAAISSAVFISLKLVLGWTGTVGIYAGIAFLCMLPLHFFCKERVKFERKPMSMMSVYKYLFRNKHLLIYFVGYLFIQMTNTIQIAAPYFVKYNLRNEGMLIVLMGISVVPVLAIAPFLPKLIRYFGKRTLTIWCCIITLVLSTLQYFVGYDSMAFMIPLLAVRVLFMQLPLLIYGMFTADCIEYGAMINGQRTEGIAFSVQTLMTQLGGALAGTLCLQILSLTGYLQPTFEIAAPMQPASALNGIWMLLTLAPIVGYGAMLIVMLFFYKLDEAQVTNIMKQNRGQIE